MYLKTSIEMQCVVCTARHNIVQRVGAPVCSEVCARLVPALVGPLITTTATPAESDPLQDAVHRELPSPQYSSLEQADFSAVFSRFTPAQIVEYARNEVSSYDYQVLREWFADMDNRRGELADGVFEGDDDYRRVYTVPRPSTTVGWILWLKSLRHLNRIHHGLLYYAGAGNRPLDPAQTPVRPARPEDMSAVLRSATVGSPSTSYGASAQAAFDALYPAGQWTPESVADAARALYRQALVRALKTPDPVVEAAYRIGARGREAGPGYEDAVRVARVALNLPMDDVSAILWLKSYARVKRNMAAPK